MAKLVTLTRDMRPNGRAGDRIAIMDDSLVEKLHKAGDVRDVGPYPPPDVAPRIDVLRPKRYATRGKA